MKKNINKIISGIAAMATVLSMVGGVNPAFAATYTSVSDTLSAATPGNPVLSLNATGVVHTITFTDPTGIGTGKSYTVHFPTGFTVQSAPTGSSVCLDSFSFTSSTMVATSSGGCAAGTITITGGTADNPTSGPGSYAFTIDNDDNSDTGSFAVAIVDNDQVTVTATVDPSLSFDVGADANTCDSAWTSSTHAVNLGSLLSSDISASDYTLGGNTPNHICTKVSSNATGGVQVTVASLNSGLLSASATHTIPSSTTSITAGTEQYGLCADDTIFGQTSGAAATSDWTGGDCTDMAHTGTVNQVAFTGSAQNLWHVTAPTATAFYQLNLHATTSGTTPAASDYTDTLTFVATGTF